VCFVEADLGEGGSRSVILSLDLTASRVQSLVHSGHGGGRHGDVAHVHGLHQDGLGHKLEKEKEKRIRKRNKKKKKKSGCGSAQKNP